MDLECYRNYFLFKARRADTGQTVSIEMYDGQPLDTERIRNILDRYELVTFNGRDFDVPLLYCALKGYNCSKLKDICNDIIGNRLKSWDVERKYAVKIPRNLKHIDLIEVAPGTGSLKIYGGRIHSPKMQDLPIEHEAILTREQMGIINVYCGNDLEVTGLLLEELTPQLELRRAMSEKYGEDMMSKSDAQIAEAIIKTQMYELTGIVPTKPSSQIGKKFKFKTPDWVKYQSQMMRDVLKVVEETEFVVAPSGKVLLPKVLENLVIKLGVGKYTLRMGGLHSSEKHQTVFADDETLVIDRDVTSYYPFIILNNGLYPEGLGPEFLTIYGKIIFDRVAAKRAGDDVTAGTYKIVLNGTFGKLGSPYSIMYSPNLLIQVTLIGQLGLLMFIERLVAEGFDVVSANTDGIVIKCPKHRKDDLSKIVAWWESVTGFGTEDTNYKAVYSRDVNNYIALTIDGKVKRKGEYAKPGLQKNPATEICVDAAISYIINGTPIEATIGSCRDVTKFLAIRNVTGGGTQEGEYLGKAVRWVYSTKSKGPITYKENGNKVAKSDGAYPLMQLPDRLPSHIDYDWYVKEANSMLVDMGHAPDTSKWLDNLL